MIWSYIITKKLVIIPTKTSTSKSIRYEFEVNTCWASTTLTPRNYTKQLAACIKGCFGKGAQIERKSMVFCLPPPRNPPILSPYFLCTLKRSAIKNLAHFIQGNFENGIWNSLIETLILLLNTKPICKPAGEYPLSSSSSRIQIQIRLQIQLQIQIQIHL